MSSSCTFLALILAFAIALSFSSSAKADINIEPTWCVHRTGFTKQCRNISLSDDGSKISAICPSESNKETANVFDLERFLKNEDGSLVVKACHKYLVFQRDCDFSNTCTNVDLVRNENDNTTTLFAQCKTASRKPYYEKASINLDNFIGVSNKGKLQWTCNAFPIHWKQ